ncbi:MAG: hypothetical protein PHO29_08825 [Acetobacterium sp.]|nr:hypothetical protein [Acetobacterium sp.]
MIQFDIGEGSLSNRQLFAVINTIDSDSRELAYPDGLKVDSKGNLYIGQYSMGRILEVAAMQKNCSSTCKTTKTN